MDRMRRIGTPACRAAADEIERLRDLAYYHCGQGNLCTWRDRWETTKAAMEEADRQITRQQAEIERLRAENKRLRFLLTDIIADFASTEGSHDDVYYVWEQIVRRANGIVADVIRDVSDHNEGWCWDMQLPKEDDR